MKFVILQESFGKNLAQVMRAVASRAQLPVLANILLEAEEGGLRLSATDLELGIVVKIPAKVEKEGRVSVPAKTLMDFVGALPPGKVEVELVKESLGIRAGGYLAKIQTIAAEEFPSLPKVGEGRGVKIGRQEWERAVGRVAYAAAKDSLRPVLTGVLLESRGGKMRLVATDGFRLALSSVKVEGEWGKGPALVPARAIQAMARVGEGEEIGLELREKTNQVIAQVGEGGVIAQLLAGNYPEYKKIIPSEFEGEVRVSREELLAALRAVQTFARDSANVVKWQVRREGIRLVAITPERGEAEAEVSGKLEGQEGEIVFNAKFVLEFLAASEAEEVALSFSGALKPGLFREVGTRPGVGADVAGKDVGLDDLYIVMPINA